MTVIAALFLKAYFFQISFSCVWWVTAKTVIPVLPPGVCIYLGFTEVAVPKICLNTISVKKSGADVIESEEKRGCLAPDCGSRGSGFETHEPPISLLA